MEPSLQKSCVHRYNFACKLTLIKIICCITLLCPSWIVNCVLFEHAAPKRYIYIEYVFLVNLIDFLLSCFSNKTGEDIRKSDKKVRNFCKRSNFRMQIQWKSKSFPIYCSYQNTSVTQLTIIRTYVSPSVQDST